MEILEKASLVVDEDGIIADIGKEPDFSQKYVQTKFVVDIDATGKSVVPGFLYE